MQYITLGLLLFLFVSCGVNDKKELIQDPQNKISTIIEEKENENLIQEWDVNKTLILSENKEGNSQQFIFDKTVENDIIYLSIREEIIIDNVNDLNTFKQFLEYGKKYDNLIIDSFDISMNHNIYSSDLLNDLINLFEGSSFHLNVQYTKSDQYIPTTTENIEKIMNHTPPAFFSFTSNFSQYPGKEDLDKLRKIEYENIEQFEEEYFNNWDSENSIVFFGKYPVQKR